jgi:hypothetical protein
MPVQIGTLTVNYGKVFIENEEAIRSVNFTFRERFRTAGANPTIAQFRTVLTDTLPLINALPASIVTEFSRERAAYYATRFGAVPADGDIPSANLATCQTYYDFLAPWIAGLQATLADALVVDLKRKLNL